MDKAAKTGEGMEGLTFVVKLKCKNRKVHPTPRKVTDCGRLPPSLLKESG